MIIDLTYPVRSEMLVWPGGERPVFEWKCRANSEVCNLTRMSMSAHTGTHVDAPLHFKEDGMPLDELPLSHFFSRARMCRVEEEPNGQEISLDSVLKTGFSLDGAGIFVLATGIERFAETHDYNFKFPVPSFELLKWLISNGVKTYMTDATSLDRVAETDEAPRHKFLFEHNIPVVENLNNLSKLPHNKDFTISAMPLLLMGREGSPCRAAAMI